MSRMSCRLLGLFQSEFHCDERRAETEGEMMVMTR